MKTKTGYGLCLTCSKIHGEATLQNKGMVREKMNNKIILTNRCSSCGLYHEDMNIFYISEEELSIIIEEDMKDKIEEMIKERKKYLGKPYIEVCSFCWDLLTGKKEDVLSLHTALRILNK